MSSSPRRAVAAAFLIHSAVSGTWAPRLPAIKESLGLSDGELGTALVGLAIGLVVGTRLAGAPIDRWGSRPFMRAGFPLLAATLLLPGLAESGLTLFASLCIWCVECGGLDLAAGEASGEGRPPYFNRPGDSLQPTAYDVGSNQRTVGGIPQQDGVCLCQSD